MRERVAMNGSGSGARIGAISGIVGGALLIAGSFMTWATASVNIDKLAEAFGIDPSLLAAAAGGVETSTSVTGIGGGDGWITLVAGVVVIAGAGFALARGETRVGGVLMVVGGVVGSALALYDATNAKDVAINQITRGALAGQELPANVPDFFSVSVGVGLWTCVIGGVVALIAAVWLMVRGGSTPMPAVGPGVAAGTGDAGDGSGDP